MDRKLLISFVGIIFIISAISFYVGKQNSNDIDATVQQSTNTNVKNEIDDQFGWGKTDNKINITAENVVKGVTIKKYGEYTYPMPIVELSIKNNGPKTINSFGITYNFSDIDNKINLGTYGVASGDIEPNWTTRKHLLKIPDQDYFKKIGGNSPIDFRIRVQIYVETKNKDTIQLYKTIFEPNELTQLPVLN